MAKYVLRWNAGTGDCYDTFDAESEDEAEKQAYELWREDTENNADYEAMEYTEEMAEELGLD